MERIHGQPQTMRGFKKSVNLGASPLPLAPESGVIG